MKFQKFLPFMLAGALALSITACNKNDDDDDNNNNNNNSATDHLLTGNVTSNMSLTNDKAWTLKGYVYVQDGATLTIPAGTIIKSDVLDKGAIIVERGGKIMAEGTVDKPIIFTSGLPKGQRRPGDWGGIILLGKAPTNRATEPVIEGGVDRKYGGTDAADNSGTLKYVRIEFGGIAAAPGSEINGLTLGGVGSGTTIENVMVSYGNDDGYEFFGGTVNCKNLIAFSCLDDDFDFDFGYVGSISNAISFKNPLLSDAGDASNGIEADNDGSGSNATPNTHPKLKNFTFVGPNKEALTFNFANRWRRAVQFTLENSVMIGFPKGGFSMESEATGAAYMSGTSVFKNNLVHAVAAPYKVSSDTKLDVAAVEAKATADGNVKLASADDAGLTDPFKVTAPNFAPKAGSQAAAKSAGAITGTDWTTGWTNWDPNTAEY